MKKIVLLSLLALAQTAQPINKTLIGSSIGFGSGIVGYFYYIIEAVNFNGEVSDLRYHLKIDAMNETDRAKEIARLEKEKIEWKHSKEIIAYLSQKQDWCKSKKLTPAEREKLLKELKSAKIHIYSSCLKSLGSVLIALGSEIIIINETDNILYHQRVAQAQAQQAARAAQQAAWRQQFAQVQAQQAAQQAALEAFELQLRRMQRTQRIDIALDNGISIPQSLLNTHLWLKQLVYGKINAMMNTLILMNRQGPIDGIGAVRLPAEIARLIARHVYLSGYNEPQLVIDYAQPLPRALPAPTDADELD